MMGMEPPGRHAGAASLALGGLGHFPTQNVLIYECASAGLLGMLPIAFPAHLPVTVALPIPSPNLLAVFGRMLPHSQPVSDFDVGALPVLAVVLVGTRSAPGREPVSYSRLVEIVRERERLQLTALGTALSWFHVLQFSEEFSTAR